MVAYFPIPNEISHYFINMNTWVIYIYSYILYQQHWTTQLLAWSISNLSRYSLYLMRWWYNTTGLYSRDYNFGMCQLRCSKCWSGVSEAFPGEEGLHFNGDVSSVQGVQAGHGIYHVPVYLLNGHWMDLEVPYSQNLSGFCLGIMIMFDRHFPCKDTGMAMWGSDTPKEELKQLPTMNGNSILEVHGTGGMLYFFEWPAAQYINHAGLYKYRYLYGNDI